MNKICILIDTISRTIISIVSLTFFILSLIYLIKTNTLYNTNIWIVICIISILNIIIFIINILNLLYTLIIGCLYGFKFEEDNETPDLYLSYRYPVDIILLIIYLVVLIMNQILFHLFDTKSMGYDMYCITFVFIYWASYSTLKVGITWYIILYIYI
jgi:hypothetical protein